MLSLVRSTPWLFLNVDDQPVDDALVPVVAAELRVAVGGLDLEHAVADLEDRHVEGAAAEVEHEDRLVGVLLVEAVGERGGRRLVDDAEHLEPGDLAGLLGGGALGVVEVGGHGDDGLGDGVAEVALGVSLQLLQRAGRDLLGRVLLAVDLDRPVGAHLALDRADGAVGVGDRPGSWRSDRPGPRRSWRRRRRTAWCGSPRRWG